MFLRMPFFVPSSFPLLPSLYRQWNLCALLTWLLKEGHCVPRGLFKVFSRSWMEEENRAWCYYWVARELESIFKDRGRNLERRRGFIYFIPSNPVTQLSCATQITLKLSSDSTLGLSHCSQDFPHSQHYAKISIG